MARITIEDCLEKVNNRFLLVNMVARRVRQIREGSEYLVSAPKNEDIVVSLREVAAGRIRMNDGDAVLPEPDPAEATLLEAASPSENAEAEADQTEEAPGAE
jgi:DNA-directed RNA polymerase subunit omega